MSKDNGGPAFPQMRVWNAAMAEYEDTQQYPGMTLRDWFAGQAINGLLSGRAGARLNDSILGGDAKLAYEIADAMIVARAGK